MQRRSLGPFSVAPVGFGATGSRSVVGRQTVVEEAARLGLTPVHVGLGWALALAPYVLVIPGASSVDHLRENLKASEGSLDKEAMQRLSAL